MKILIIHSHNANRGDEAAVKAMVDELLYKYNDLEIVISNNGFTPYPNMPTQVKQIDRFPKLQSRFSQFDFFLSIFSRGELCFTKANKEFIKELKEADLVIHAPGGPSIGDTYLDAEKLYLWRFNFIRKMGKKYMFYAPSMGPFKCEKRNALRKKILNGAEVVILRDPISYNYVQELVPSLKIIQAMDSALQHDVDYDYENSKYLKYQELRDFVASKEKCIGITITDLAWHPIYSKTNISTQIEKCFKEFIAEKIKEGYGIVFIPQLYGSGDDSTLMNKYSIKGQTFTVEANNDEYDNYFQQYLISKLYAIVGMRYHSNIFSAKVGTPFVSVSYEQKMKGFMQSINLSQYCLDLDKLNINNLNSQFDLLIKNYDEYSNKLSKLHSEMKKKSYISTEKVIEILEKK